MASTFSRTRLRRRGRATLLVAMAASLGFLVASPAAVAGDTQKPAPARTEIPPGVTAGVAVFDRETGAFTEKLNATKKFRSASVVKLLITLDFLWDRGPDYTIPPEDRARLEAMLRTSANDPASYYWVQRGGSQIVDRMAARLNLTGTEPPPPSHPGYWGYTAITAADTVRIYRYILDSAPAPVRDFVMSNLHQAKRCASDGYDQYFGIPSAFDRPWAVKQGWSGFSSGGCTAGSPATTTQTASRAGGPSPGATVDLVSEALHTTGTAGNGDRSIVVVYTLHPDGTPYGTAYSRMTDLVRSLNVPGAHRG